MLLRAEISATVVPNRAAIAVSVSPERTLYVFGRGVVEGAGVAVGRGVGCRGGPRGRLSAWRRCRRHNCAGRARRRRVVAARGRTGRQRTARQDERAQGDTDDDDRRRCREPARRSFGGKGQPRPLEDDGRHRHERPNARGRPSVAVSVEPRWARCVGRTEAVLALAIQRRASRRKQSAAVRAGGGDPVPRTVDGDEVGARLESRRHGVRKCRGVGRGIDHAGRIAAARARCRCDARPHGDRPRRERHAPETQRSWRRPIFPKGCPLSILGAGELNFRVRDGNGCGLSARVTRILCV